MVSKIVSKADKKFYGIENQPVVTEAIILEPRLKKKRFYNNYSYQQTYEKN